MANKLPSLRLSRRSFLAGAVLAPTALSAYFYGPEALGATLGAIEAREAWQVAALDNERFLAASGSVFSKVSLGCSFTQEEWPQEQRADGTALRALAFCVEDLGLKEVRLDLRWDRVATASGAIDLTPYRPLLDYCFGRDVNLCLNLGPLRTFRWPEDRVPEHVLSSLSRRPERGEQIEWGSPLAQAAVSYLDRLLDALLAEYGDGMRRLSSVQPENESFQSFDAQRWPVSTEYMKNVIHRLDQRLPGVPILVTSAGRPALGTITALFDALMRDSTRFKGRLISGFDYYYSTPEHNKLPFDRYLDPIALAFSFPAPKTCAENIEDSRRVGFRLEVSEGQAEPYAHITAPGNSAQDFRFMLLRCAGKALDPEQPSVLRIWGVEQLAKKAATGTTNGEHEAIFDLLRRLAK